MVFSNIMTTQINIRLSQDFLDQAREYARLKGYLNVQEFFRESAREKLFENNEIRSDYIKKLKSKEANTFSSLDDSKKFIENLRIKAITIKK
jgi:hypothetical protein